MVAENQLREQFKGFHIQTQPESRKAKPQAFFASDFLAICDFTKKITEMKKINKEQFVTLWFELYGMVVHVHFIRLFGILSLLA